MRFDVVLTIDVDVDVVALVKRRKDKAECKEPAKGKDGDGSK